MDQVGQHPCTNCLGQRYWSSYRVKGDHESFVLEVYGMFWREFHHPSTTPPFLYPIVPVETTFITSLEVDLMPEKS